MILIDKEKLIKVFDNECVGECGCCRHSYDMGKCGFIENFPAEIELVRCKECKNLGYTNSHWFCKWLNRCVDEDWFCADGRKRDA